MNMNMVQLKSMETTLLPKPSEPSPWLYWKRPTPTCNFLSGSWEFWLVSRGWNIPRERRKATGKLQMKGLKWAKEKVFTES